MLSSATGSDAAFHTDTNDVSAVLANATRRRPDTYEVRSNAELVYGRTAAPPAQRDDGPDRFDDAERPRALQEPIEGSQRARDRESEDEPPTAILERVAHEQGGYGERPKALGLFPCDSLRAKLVLASPPGTEDHRNKKCLATLFF